jgi:hypothetical protein
VKSDDKAIVNARVVTEATLPFCPFSQRQFTLLLPLDCAPESLHPPCQEVSRTDEWGQRARNDEDKIVAEQPRSPQPRAFSVACPPFSSRYLTWCSRWNAYMR